MKEKLNKSQTIAICKKITEFECEVEYNDEFIQGIFKGKIMQKKDKDISLKDIMNSIDGLNNRFNQMEKSTNDRFDQMEKYVNDKFERLENSVSILNDKLNGVIKLNNLKINDKKI